MQKTFAPHTAIVIILAVLGAAACGRGIVPLNPTTPVLLESQADPAELRAAIIRALEARRYTTEAEEPGQHHRDRVAPRDRLARDPREDERHEQRGGGEGEESRRDP